MATHTTREKLINFGDIGNPFQVFFRADPDDNKLVQFKINKFSALNRTLSPEDTVVITGLDTWYPFDTKKDLIWLEYDIQADIASIKSKGKGDTWINLEEVVKFNPSGEQALFVRIPIGNQSINNNIALFYPIVITNLILRQIAFNGAFVLYPFPFSGPVKIW